MIYCRHPSAATQTSNTEPENASRPDKEVLSGREGGVDPPVSAVWTRFHRGIFWPWLDQRVPGVTTDPLVQCVCLGHGQTRMRALHGNRTFGSSSALARKEAKGLFFGGSAALRTSSLLLNNLTHISVGLSPQEGSCKPARLPAQEVPFHCAQSHLENTAVLSRPAEEPRNKGYKDAL